MADFEVGDVHEFIDEVESAYGEWGTDQLPWFRGEPSEAEEDIDVHPLRPKVFRREYDENALLQFFRSKAPVYDLDFVPAREATDQWMFLARHVGLPTRLLDWTEGALIALYFALDAAEDEDPVVWMLNPLELNRKTAPKPEELKPNDPTITWAGGRENLYHANVKAAWELDIGGTSLPIAIHPTNVHPLMRAQHACFTIHGQRKEGLAEMVGDDCVRSFEIQMAPNDEMARLRRLGISRSAIFPTARGLAEELDWLREYLPGGED